MHAGAGEIVSLRHVTLFMKVVGGEPGPVACLPPVLTSASCQGVIERHVSHSYGSSDAESTPGFPPVSPCVSPAR